MWTLSAWVGRYLAVGAKRSDDLGTYATWCSTVEGNTTFYALPSETTVSHWAQLAPNDFRFSFKLPRTITHDRRLRNASSELTEFCKRTEPLVDRLGPTWVQLPGSFGPEDLPVLDRFLHQLPKERPWAVELRHRSFEAEGSSERAANDLLFTHGVDRTIFDSRAFFAGPCETAAEQEAWQQKPRLRVRPVALGRHPTVRFVGQTSGDANPPFWQPWVSKVAQWLSEGRQPMVYIHTPDNACSPDLARQFYDEVAEVFPSLPPLSTPVAPAKQTSLFIEK